MRHIAIFASGTGSNAKKIIEHLNVNNQSKEATVALVVSNNPGAEVLKIAAAYQIKTLVIEKEKFCDGTAYTEELKNAGIDFIVLAGFLWKIPAAFIKEFNNRIINIHPALLPKYGGKGMYGRYVHESILANKEKESGITIHYVDEIYDNGQIILQATCLVDEKDTPESLARKVQELEHRHFPPAVAMLSRL